MEIKKIMVNGEEKNFITSLDDDMIEEIYCVDLDRPTIDLSGVVDDVKKIIESGNSNG